jgi:energy-coupling factor transporter ATP-binding protein EcfA2
MNLREIIEDVLNNYIAAKKEIFTSNDMARKLRTDFPEIIFNSLHISRDEFIVTGSPGQGNWATVPWVGIFNKKITSNATKGVYIVYLFASDCKTVYLTFNQGCTELKKTLGKKSAVLEMQKNAAMVIDLIQDRGFEKGDSIDLKDTRDLPYLYERGTIFYKEYKINKLPNNEDLISDLSSMKEIYDDYIKTQKSTNDKPEEKKVSNSEEKVNNNKDVRIAMNHSVILKNIHAFIKNNGFCYEQEMIKNLYLSLKSKPFVILAGISGTGKSKIVKMFSEAIGATTLNGQYKLIPVRPDWSDSTDLLGHLNLDNRFIPGVVTEFLEEANKIENLDKPYILCLDEMNLARVEYYFSDFLSVLETRCMNSEGRIVSDKLLTKTSFGSDASAIEKYGDLLISENVYIVGTVNMDETTFPFSKKVLDRANTIEFSDINLSLGTEKLSTIELLTVQVDNSFLKSEYIRFSECYRDNSDEIDDLILLLDRINNALRIINAQVAYRIRDEVSYYITYAKKYDLISFNEAIDNALLQKILPRVHGSSLALRGVFRELFKICVGHDNFEDNELLEQIEAYMKNSSGKLRFPKSAAKVAFMLRRFEEDGYTSYWL